VTYAVEVDNDASFGSPEYSDSVSITSAEPSSPLPQGTYHWRVQASNGCGTEGYSDAWTFTIQDAVAAPTLTTPANRSDTCDTTPTFSWGSVAGASDYIIEIDDDASFASPEVSGYVLDTTYTVPSDHPLTAGTYHWRVHAQSGCGAGPSSTAWTLTINDAPGTAPVPIGPADGAETCDTKPSFSWQQLAGATSYRIFVDNDASFASPEIDETISATSFTASTDLAPGVYHWKVQASNVCGDGPASASRALTIQSPPPATTLSAPADGSDTCDLTPTFQWNSVAGATYYQLYVDDDPGFSSPEISVDQAGTSYAPSTALAPATYHWRVMAANACGGQGWSPIWQHNLLATPAAPALVLPGNGTTSGDSTPAFTWNSVSGAVTYRFVLDDDASFSSPLYDETVSNPTFTPPAPLSAGTYHWHVKASNGCGSSTWSTPAWSFVVGVDNTPPAAVTDLAAATGSASGNVGLTWTAPGDDGHTGTASAYDLRYHTVPITDANWGAASIVNGEPAPGPAGTGEHVTVAGLTPGGVFYFAVKTEDEVPNISAISNSPGATAGSGGQIHLIHLPLVIK
jgi:hypothetical protein